MVIAMANQKGGVAKTTCTHNLGVALANKGKKVLLIDFDSQASLTISVGIEPLDIENNIVPALKKNGKPIKECINKINSNLFIVTSIIDLAQIEMEMMTSASREKILDRALSSIKKEYDYIIIDCPPQLSILTINALSCADSVIIPVKTDYLAYRGLTQLENTITEIRELINPELKNLGVIATLYEMKIKDDVEILQELKKKYKVIGIVKKLAIAKKGIYDGQSVIEQNPLSELAIEYMKIADIIICESGV
jgi:chromosome partitioning protein